MTGRAFHALWPSLASTNWCWTHNLERRNKVRLQKLAPCVWEWYSNTGANAAFSQTQLRIQAQTNVLRQCAVTLWHTYSWLRVDVYVLLRLCEDRTGRDKGSSVGVFTANTAEENSLRRWRGSRLMATAKELELSCCEKSPQSQESEQEILSTPFKTTTTILGERKTL